MAYQLDDDIEREIQSAFSSEQSASKDGDDSLQTLFRNHKKLTIKFLNRKWNISSLKSHIENRIILRGLRERVTPAGHLHTPRFIEAWKASCVKRGLEIMQMIVDEEEIQLNEIKADIEVSAGLLEPFKTNPALTNIMNSSKKK